MKVIVTHRKFSDWLKSYHKHHIYRWDTTQETLNFFPFTRDDYVRTVRAVNDQGKTPGSTITFTQLEQAAQLYREINTELEGVADYIVNYESMKFEQERILRDVFKTLDVDPSQSQWITKEMPFNQGQQDSDASETSLDEYFGDETGIVADIMDTEEELHWLSKNT
jgi:hypothetical protein